MQVHPQHSQPSSFDQKSVPDFVSDQNRPGLTKCEQPATGDREKSSTVPRPRFVSLIFTTRTANSNQATLTIVTRYPNYIPRAESVSCPRTPCPTAHLLLPKVQGRVLRFHKLGSLPRQIQRENVPDVGASISSFQVHGLPTGYRGEDQDGVEVFRGRL